MHEKVHEHMQAHILAGVDEVEVEGEGREGVGVVAEALTLRLVHLPVCIIHTANTVTPSWEKWKTYIS